MLRRLLNFFRPSHLDADMREELEFHQSQTSGSLGNVTLVQERMRDASTINWLETAWQDLRYGVRVMRRTPWISLIAIVSLALGIGANAAIFSLIDHVLISILPVRDPQQLVLFRDVESYIRYKDLRSRSDVFSDVAGTASLSGVPFDGSDRAEDLITGRLVSGNYFRTLGVQPLIGRPLSQADDTEAGAHPFIVISYFLWRDRFHSDPEVIGKPLRLGAGRLNSGWRSSGFEENQPAHSSGREFIIQGVMPPAFIGETVGERPDFWAPLTMEEQFLPGRYWLSRRTAQWVRIIARLKPGIGLTRAEAATTVLNRNLLLEAEGIGMSANQRRQIEQSRVKLLPGEKGFSSVRQQFVKPLWALLAMVAVVLLIACANLANLLLAKGAARWREIATRLALGVDRSRLIRQLITESFLLSICGAVLSVPVGWIAGRMLFSLAAEANSTLNLDLTPDLRVLLFTGAVAILTTFLFGALPALRSTRVDIQSVLKEGAHTTQSGRSRMTGEKVVVVLQVALSTILLFGTVMFTRTLYNLRAQDFGYSPESLVTARVDPTTAGYKGIEIGQIAQRVLEKLRTTPGINSASYSDNGLFAGQDSSTRLRVEGFVPASPNDAVARFDQVGPGYFATVGIPILLGREFTDKDNAGSTRVAVINESMARFYFNKRNPLGATIVCDNDLKFALTVIGVTRDVKASVRDHINRRFYVPYMQPVDGQMGADLEMRSSLPVSVLDHQVRQAVQSVSPRLHIEFVRSLKTSMDNSIIGERIVARLSILFGLLALLLGAIGLYGVMAYSVTRRTQEIGVRIAIGGRPLAIVWMILADTIQVVAIGLLSGIPIAILLGRLLQSILFGVSPTDIWTALPVVGLMVAIAFLASVIPARKATRINPVIALRCE